MKLTGILILACVFAASSTSGVSAESLYDYLFTTRNYPSILSNSLKVAEKERDRISKLVKEVKGLALFLPINDAWNQKPGALDALLREPEGNIRYDMVLASSAEVPMSYTTSWALLKQYADKNGGVIDSAYGTPYFIMDDGRFCLAEWSNGQYIEGECARVIGAPVRLSDTTLYQVTKVLLPSDLEESVKGLMTQRRRI